MPVLATDVLEVVVRGQASGQDILNVLHYRTVDPSAWPVAGVAINLLSGSFIARWRLWMPVLVETYLVNEYRFNLYRGIEVNPTPPPANRLANVEQLIVGGADPNDRGDIITEPLPTFVALGIRKLTDRPGRSFRGGFRLGPYDEPATSGNALNAAKVTAVTGIFTPFLIPIGTGTPGETMELAVFSETTAIRRTVITPDSRQDTARVTALSLNPFTTSQVSRKQSLFSPT